VAELGNNSVSIVDLKEKKVLHRITGLNEPQGVDTDRTSCGLSWLGSDELTFKWLP
jgi:hypothetical protein